VGDVAYSPRQAMKHLGVSRSTLYRWVREGRLPTYQLPSGHHRFLERDLAALRDNRPKLGRPFTKEKAE
jgi:excisionase family DNA binding protein